MFYWLGESGDPRIPTVVRDDARTFGLDPSYYLDPHENDRANWMTQLYVREARALIGRMVLEATDVTATEGTAPRSLNTIADGSYPIDSHHVRRFVDLSTGTARVICEGNLFTPVGGNKRFPIAMEMIVPQAAECSNLLVTFAASARYTGFGALRMEMVHMAMSEAAGIMSLLAVANDNDEPDYSLIRPKLLAAGCVAGQVN